MPPEGFGYQPGFLEPLPATELLDRLWAELNWEQYRVRLFGRDIPQPRLTAWCCDRGVTYSYSGIRLGPAPWHPLLDDMRSRLRAETGMRFNSVLANAYRDGNDAMGWHADDEPELGDAPVIASLSLGAARRMLVRPKTGGPSVAIELEHGSLLLMRGNSQADWLHCVPRTRRPLGLRINLTYRLVIGPGRDRPA
mgnify:CR=1 FL=1